MHSNTFASTFSGVDELSLPSMARKINLVDKKLDRLEQLLLKLQKTTESALQKLNRFQQSEFKFVKCEAFSLYQSFIDGKVFQQIARLFFREEFLAQSLIGLKMLVTQNQSEFREKEQHLSKLMTSIDNFIIGVKFENDSSQLYIKKQQGKVLKISQNNSMVESIQLQHWLKSLDLSQIEQVEVIEIRQKSKNENLL